MPHGINRQKNLQFIFVSCRDTAAKVVKIADLTKKLCKNLAECRIIPIFAGDNHNW